MRAYIRAGLILVVVAFLVVRIVRPCLNAYQFQKLVQSEVEEARQRGGAGNLHGRILEHGRAMGMKVTAQDIEVQRLTKGYLVRVSYAVPLNFSVYQTEIVRSFEARSPFLGWE